MVAVRNCSTREGSRKRLRLALLAVAFGGLLVALLPPGPATAATLPPMTERTASVPALAPEPTLSVSPGTWTMAAASRAVFSVAVGNLPAGCTVEELAVSWSLPGISAEDGFLNASSGPTVELITYAGPGGPATIAATANGVVGCGGQSYGIAPNGLGELTILPSLSAGTPTCWPDPATVGALVTLEETVSGGLAPFSVTLDFGDGTSGSTTLAEPGPLVVTHRFPAGRYTPSWAVTDALGDERSVAPMSPLVVSDALAVAIDPPVRAVDVGVGTTFHVSISGGEAPYFVSWTSSIGLTGIGPNWTVTPQLPGNVDIRVVVTDLGGTSVGSDATLAVAGPLRLVLGTGSPVGDVGRAVPFVVNLTGAVPPFSVGWAPVGGGENRSAELPADGWYLEAVTTGLAGTLWVTVTAEDALGVRLAATAPVAAIYPPPSITLTSGALLSEPGERFGVGGELIGGSPPVSWSLTASLPVNSTGPSTGVLNGSGAFGWEATALAGGNLTFLATARDAAGVWASANLTVRVLPPLLLSLLPPSGLVVGTPAVLSAEFGGGDPPYAYALTSTDGERLVGNLSTAGPVQLGLTPRSAGYVELRLLVTDLLGGRGESVLTVVATVGPTVPAPTAPGPSSPSPPAVSDPTWLVGLLGAGGVAAAILLPRRRRRTRRREGPGSPAEAMHAVRRYLQESEGLDRATLYFLAEDDGLSETQVDDALRRWQRSHRVRTEPGPDEEPLFFWDEGGPSGSALGGASEPEGSPA
ncbi:MAG: hypothetical protein L3K23_08530 [Thermoplasmata archaeon]|nr:hypothetical protein [Thermoplasmata archaeon]